jgi:hypothetical protein
VPPVDTQQSQKAATYNFTPDRGGHFAAMEAPDLLVDDIRAFARLVR